MIQNDPSCTRARCGVSFLILLSCLAFTLPAAAQREKRVITNDDLTASPSEEFSRAAESGPAGPDRANKGAPFVSTPMPVVDRMLELAGVTAADVVFDLGSGDGRFVLRAAQKYKARSVGIEIEPALIKQSMDRAQEMGVDKLATFTLGDIFNTDLRSATVVTVFLLQETNERLQPVLESQLQPGTRIVSHQFPFPGWVPVTRETMQVGAVSHPIFYYVAPQSFAKPAR